MRWLLNLKWGFKGLYGHYQVLPVEFAQSSFVSTLITRSLGLHPSCKCPSTELAIKLFITIYFMGLILCGLFF